MWTMLLIIMSMSLGTVQEATVHPGFRERVTQGDVFNTEIVCIKQPEIRELLIVILVRISFQINTGINGVRIRIGFRPTIQMPFAGTGVFKKCPGLFFGEFHFRSRNALTEYTQLNRIWVR